MTAEAEPPDPLPGFKPRHKFAADAGKTDQTAKRWQDAGKIVVRYIGRDPYVDLEATAARVRGEDRPRRRGAKP